MISKIHLSKKDLNYLHDTDFLLTKIEILNKIFKLMDATREELINIVKGEWFPFPAGTETSTGKISKGENYLGLPYMVLDYPALFKKNNIFSYRTMFWWGNFFSATLHLQESSLNKYRNAFINNFDTLKKEQNLYISIGSSPWQYYYDSNNYVLLDTNHKDHIKSCEFLKLSKKISIKEWNNVPMFSSEFLKFILTILNNFQ